MYKDSNNWHLWLFGKSVTQSMSLVKEATLPKKQDLFKLNLKSTSNCNVCQTSWVRSKSISIIILDLGPLDSQVMIRLAIVKWPKYVISEMWCLLGSTQSCEIHSGISQFPFVKGSILWAKIILLYLLSFCTNMLNLFNFQSIPFYSNVIWKKIYDFDFIHHKVLVCFNHLYIFF